MPEDSVERKLRAILCADVKGYSRMMGEDEVGTYQTLTAKLESIRSIISKHDGRVFSSPGDAIMAEFASVVDTVQCAVELQDKIEASNAEVPEDQKMQFRIGVNLGDMIHDGEQVYGDGVNIAARIETLAEPGGVSISNTVYDQVYNKLNYGFEYTGEHAVKNMIAPVQVYKVVMKSDVTGLVHKKKFALPDKPSLAVLPFTNMSGDSKQDYFSDGLTEEIITALSKISEMFVIARNSSFAYKGKSINIKQIGRDLGVQYVLEGSVRKAGIRLRITAQLIDATTGNHKWAERYDRELEDIFDLQDEIT